MLKERVAIVHYMPLEIYPPVMNLLKTWDKMKTGLKLDVFTTAMSEEASPFQPASADTYVHRYGVSGKKSGRVVRFFRYLDYFLTTFFMLVKTRPVNVLYFDSISSFPAVIYKILFARSRLFVHYNEYMSPKEYLEGMFLIKYFHKLENKIYARTEWLSHTNKERMNLFLADLPGISVPYPQVIPNFPPADWAVHQQKKFNFPLRIVYTGALSLDTMYTVLFAEWVIKQKAQVTWDIYTLNITGEAAEYIRSLPRGIVRLHNGVSYYELPCILRNYDVGVILYNGHIPNYIFNAPNKLFEYATAGLDVWFPKDMQSSMQYTTGKSYPKIIAMDFLQLYEIKLGEVINREGLTFNPHAFNCETALSPLLGRLAVTTNR